MLSAALSEIRLKFEVRALRTGRSRRCRCCCRRPGGVPAGTASLPYPPLSRRRAAPGPAHNPPGVAGRPGAGGGGGAAGGGRRGRRLHRDLRGAGGAERPRQLHDDGAAGAHGGAGGAGGAGDEAAAGEEEKGLAATPCAARPALLRVRAARLPLSAAGLPSLTFWCSVSGLPGSQVTVKTGYRVYERLRIPEAAAAFGSRLKSRITSTESCESTEN